MKNFFEVAFQTFLAFGAFKNKFYGRELAYPIL